MIEFLKENRKNDLENQTITTLLFSKSREMIEIDVLFINNILRNYKTFIVRMIGKYEDLPPPPRKIKFSSGDAFGKCDFSWGNKIIIFSSPSCCHVNLEFTWWQQIQNSQQCIRDIKCYFGLCFYIYVQTPYSLRKMYNDT